MTKDTNWRKDFFPAIAEKQKNEAFVERCRSIVVWLLNFLLSLKRRDFGIGLFCVFLGWLLP